MPTPWTDHPATDATRMRARHINELRTAVENTRTPYSPPPGGWTPWTDHPVTSSTRIRAQHFVELRSAIQQLWTKESLGYTSAWTRRGGEAPSPGSPIYADDVNDLRRWLNLFEAKRYGVYSVVFDPAGNQPRIGTDWAADVKKLGVCFVRATMNSRPSDNEIAPLLETYKNLFNHYRGIGVLPIAVLTGDTDRPAFVGDPNAALNAALTNTYIDHFARRAAAIAQFMRGVVDHFEIWNEPDNWAPGTQCPELRSEQFGSMLTWCYRFIKRDPNVNPNAHIISGGLLYHDTLQGIGWDQAYLLGGLHGD